MFSPAIVYIFATLVGSTAATTHPVYRPIYVTDDQKECQAQADDWNTRMALTKPAYFCLPHNRAKLKDWAEFQRYESGNPDN